jgi:hypothetical protein
VAETGDVTKTDEPQLHTNWPRYLLAWSIGLAGLLLGVVALLTWGASTGFVTAGIIGVLALLMANGSRGYRSGRAALRGEKQ